MHLYFGSDCTELCSINIQTITFTWTSGCQRRPFWGLFSDSVEERTLNQKSEDLHSRILLCYLFYLLETLFPMQMQLILSLFSLFVLVSTKEIMYGKVFWLMVNCFANVKPILFSSLDFLFPLPSPFSHGPHQFKRLISTPKKVLF